MIVMNAAKIASTTRMRVLSSSMNMTTSENVISTAVLNEMLSVTNKNKSKRKN